MRQDWTRVRFPVMRRFLLAVGVITLACSAAFPQKRSSREAAGIAGPVRTVRIESRQLLAVTYQQSGVMVYTIIYDDQGRALESAEYLPGGNPDTRSTSVYDEHGNEIEHGYYVHDQLARRLTTRYDTRNRILEQLTFDPNGRQTGKLTFHYDKLGRRVALEVQPDGKTQRLSVAVLDGRGNELKRTEYYRTGAAGGRYVFTYSAAGNKTSEVHYYRQNGRTHSRKSTYVYDGKGNLIVKADYSDGALENKTTFKLDDRGNRTEAIETDGKGQVKEKRTWSYEVDQKGNWTRAVMSEWTDKAPREPLQPTFEYRRTFGAASDTTIALWSAARQDDASRVQALLRQGADVNASHPDGGTPLIRAAAEGHMNVVRTLLAASAQVDAKDAEGWTALMWSAERGRIDTVKLLLAAGADARARSELGGVAIMPAALNGHIEVLKLLFEKGADVDAAASDGSTALMVTAQRGQIEALKFLLEKGADPHLRTKGGMTPLFFAASGSSIESVNALLERGVDINSRASGGTTPLMVAASRPEISVLQFLIQKGADISAKTDDGETALSLAIKSGSKEAAELLRKAGAK